MWCWIAAVRKELRGKRLPLRLQLSVVDLSDSSKQFTQQTALACLNIHCNELHYHSVRTAMVGYCIEGLSAGKQAKPTMGKWLQAQCVMWVVLPLTSMSSVLMSRSRHRQSIECHRNNIVTSYGGF